MERINPSLAKNYLPLKLYINDLFDIERVVKEYSETISIETDQILFSSIEELSNELKNQRVPKLIIRTLSPYMYIDFSRLWARIYVSSNDENSFGLFVKLNEFLLRKRRQIWFLYSYYVTWSIILLQWLFYFIIPKSFSTGIGNYIAVSFSLWVMWALFIRMRRHSLVLITKNSGFGSLWIRKKDNIILSIVAAIIGAILGIAGTLLINYLSSAN